MNDLKDNIEIGVDASGVETGVGRATQSLNSLGRAAESAGTQGAAGLGRLGEGGKAAADKIERDTRRMVQQIERVTAEMEAGSRNTSGYFEARARQMGVATASIQPYIDKLRAAEMAQMQAAKGMQNMGISAGQTAAAMRGVPAQVQDIVVSLQAGQQPMTVLLQQGGQLATTFGGIGAAARGLGTYLLSFVTPVTALAGAVALVAGVVYSANSSFDALQAKVDGAGRAIGYTTDQLHAMAGALNTGWSQSANALALAEIAESAALSSEELLKFTALAVDMERTVGTPVADTAKRFRELGDSPTEAVKKLSKELEFLTAAQYEQIKSLEEQGRKTDAARLAMNAYADAVKPSVDRAKAQLGVLGTAMEFWEKKAKDMWAAVAGAARAATDSQTGAERALAAQQRINEINSGLPFKSAGFVDSVRGMFNPEGVRQELLSKAQGELDYINKVNAAAAQNAKFDQEREARQKAGRDAIDAVSKAYDGALTKGQRMNKELTEFRANLDKIKAATPDSAFLDPKRIAEAEAAIRDKYKESGGGSKRTAAAPGENEVARIKALIAEEQAYTKALQERGAEATKLSAGEKLVMQIQEQLSTSIKGVARSNKEAALAEAQKLVSAEKARQVEERRVKALQESKEANERLVADTWKTAEGIERQASELDAANSMWGKGKVAIEEYRLQQAEEMLAMADASDSFIPEYVKSLQAIVDARKHMVEASKDQVFKQLNEGIAEWNRQAEERNRLYADEAQLAGLTTLERNKIVAAREIELKLAREIDKINKSGLADAEKEALIRDATAAAAKDKSAAVARVVQEDWKKTADSINQSLTDALLRGFEDGKDFGKNFADTLKNMFKTLVLRPVISFIVQPIGNAISGMVSGFLGGGQGGAGGILGGASNGNSILNFGSLISNWMGAGSGAAAGTLAYGNMIGALGGDGLGAFMAANGGWGTSGAGALASSAAPLAGLSVVAAPLLIGALVEGNSRDRFSGAAYATSGGNDPFVNTVAGSTSFNYLTGDLPDRAALLARLEELGAPMEAFSDWNDRALLRMLISIGGGAGVGGGGGVGVGRVESINWEPLLANFGDEADYYRGAGYTHPEAMGWWNNKGNANLSTDPALIQVSRDIALSIIGPLEGIGALIGDEATYRATVGFANRGKGSVWAGFDLQRDGQSVADWVNPDDFHSVGEAVRAMYSTALGTLDSFDLPGWADRQVTDARAALDALEGENMGQEAAALYALTTAGIEQMYRSIKLLIDVFPDFAGQTQDTVHAIATAMGGLQNLTTAYNSYLEGFYSEEERRALAMKQLGAQFADLGVALPDSRDAFRALVESQDLSTEAGKRMFAALMGLAGAFAAVTPAIDATADAAQSAADILNATRSATDDAFSALEKFIGSQRDMWQTALDAAESLIDEARSIFDTAGGAARELWGQQDETSAMLASEGNAAIRQMLDSLRATGALPDADALSRAIDGARGGLDPAAYARTADQEFAQRVLAGQLGEMSDLAGGQMTVAEQQAEYARQQIKQLDDTLDYWRKQIDLMRNTDLTVTSIADGIGKLVAAMEEERAAQAELDAARNTPAPSTGNPANAGWAIGGSSGSGGGSGGAYLDYTDFTRHYADGSSTLLGMNEVWMALWNSSGGDRAAAEAAYAAEEERRRRAGIPSFDVGTNYVPRDMTAQIHEGERIIPAADNARLMALLANASQGGQNDALVAEVKAMRAEVTALRAERTAADVPLHRMAGQFANVTAGGNAMMTETA